MATDVTPLTRADQRYEEIFSIERESADRGHRQVDDPYPDLAALRARGSVMEGSLFLAMTGQENPQFTRGRPHFTTLTFNACSRAMMDNTTYSSLIYHEQPSVMENIGHTILTMVGNEHARYRSSIQPMMTRQQAMGWWREKWIEPIVELLIDDIERQEDGTDLSLALCARLPMHTVTAAYGLDPEEALALRESLLNSMNGSLPAGVRERANAQVRQVLLEAIAERRRARRDDLISRLIDSPFNDANGEKSRLDDEAILAFSRLLLLAGGGTTFRQLGITLLALLSNPGQLEDLRANRHLMSSAFEESLRWNCTDPVFYRLATRDSEIEGYHVPEGAIIDVCLAAANRDPARWTEPDAFDLHRPVKRHMGFAAGPHTCLGRFVAEAEMTAMLNGLLDRLPRLRLDDRVVAPRIIGGLQARGVDHLRVRT